MTNPGNETKPTYRNHAEEIAAVLEEAKQAPASRIGTQGVCWGCGTTFTVQDERQLECVRCYVARKL